MDGAGTVITDDVPRGRARGFPAQAGRQGGSVVDAGTVELTLPGLDAPAEPTLKPGHCDPARRRRSG